MLIKKRFPYLNYESKNFSSMTKDSTKYLNLSGVQILESVNLFWRGLAKGRPQAPPAFIFFLFDFPQERLPPLLLGTYVVSFSWIRFSCYPSTPKLAALLYRCSKVYDPDKHRPSFLYGVPPNYIKKGPRSPRA